MRHARRRIFRRGARFAAVGGLLCGGLMVTHAMASEPSASSRAPESAARLAADKGAGLVSRLGTARTAGSWIADDGRPVVAVTDSTAAAEVERAGARPKVVRHSMQELKSVTQALKSAPRVAGTAWAMDYVDNEVVVRADSSVSASDWSRMTKLAGSMGSSVRMERTQGTFTTRLNGAQPMFSTGGRCSAGFNVTNGKNEFILTAGHCGPAGSVWFADNQGTKQLGQTITTAFPGNDFSLIQYNNGENDTGNNVVAIGGGKGVQILGAADATVGQRVFRSGSTSGLHDGRVKGLNATVNYPEGTVTGLIETDVCAEPGDSGGPLFSEGIALGVTSGGNGDCTSGGTTFFQPITKAMTALAVKLTGPGARGASGATAQNSPAPAASRGTAVAPGSVAPGSVQAVGSGDSVSLLDRLTDPQNIGPGLLVIAGSIIALVATRYIRTEQDRNRYRRQYSQSWG
ncbi:S1 family peptidase [Streptomyces sp. NBC_01571]|uniref:S1 family peptidase n=1 Tax=Streptomyces sp. NBC_01571 TaxID=2975883 RepID=UPI00224F02B8|nr:S1 family peptidase [Streptomyces sp. NBC_01571]MCX4579734.1 S1 family peptidase [Streptomyces sp. NBC_01571]